jgi:hypothetical protein
VAKVQVLDAAGREVAYYGRSEDVVNARGTFRFRTALNDPPGLWKVVVTDVISGRSAIAEVRLH